MKLILGAIMALAGLPLAHNGGVGAAGPVGGGGGRVLGQGGGWTVDMCRTMVCPHNENTDLVRRGSTIWLVHRTAMSQILGPNSSLRVYRSDDSGASFQLQAIIP